MVQEVSEIPRPEAAALEHSERLVQAIRTEIDAGKGHIGFDRYMEMALYEPGLGYYSAGARKFGKDGDYITAPELSSLFSICLARQCRQTLSDISDGVILELGAGTGKMACDILLELKRNGMLPGKYLILETSADLRQRQQQLLKEHLPDCMNRIEWLSRLPEHPVKGVILANEVMDSLPVHRVVDRNGRVKELCVTWNKDGFTWTELDAESWLVSLTENIKNQIQYSWDTPYTTEINTSVNPWIKTLAEKLKQGLILLIDYGYTRSEYYHPQRVGGTLLCHFRHRVHEDPFLYPGLQDITASVDFTTVAEAAAAAGLEISGYTTQAHFLIGCGLEEILASHSDTDQVRYLELARQVKLLTLPGEMGEIFKAIGLARGIQGKPLGFRINDQRMRL